MKNRKFKFFLYLVLLNTICILSFNCTFKSKKSIQNTKEQLTDSVDPDIVLINIQEGDRSFIGEVLQKINSCNPRVVGIDVFFDELKDPTKDSFLAVALSELKNDVLAYHFDSSDIAIKPHKYFQHYVDKIGVSNYEFDTKGIARRFTPIESRNDEIDQHFALQIVKLKDPSISIIVKKNQSIPIKFEQTLNRFVHYNGGELNQSACANLKNKIVLIGYLGPSNEDKHFTPFRYQGRFDADEPDTYGVVIVANQIRTLLDYNK